MNLNLCGIDEAGRGCLAGDLTVAGCVMRGEFDGICDSKAISEKKREELYELITKNSRWVCLFFRAKDVDELGLSCCLNRALKAIMCYFEGCEFLYDGNAKFGTNIPTMIKADAKIPSVSAASIIAKVLRDKSIIQYDKIYPQYSFCKNKGYGSSAHIEAIKKHGYSEIHRKSYKIKSLINQTLF